MDKGREAEQCRRRPHPLVKATKGLTAKLGELTARCSGARPRQKHMVSIEAGRCARVAGFIDPDGGTSSIHGCRR